MPKEYIELARARLEFERFFKGNFFKGKSEIQDDCDSLLCMLPAADVVEVVHSRWIKAQCSEKNGNATCSNCGHFDWDDCNYCSNCGHKMDGDGK